jgi:formylglycine-generating enzyme required for sulfatase activity
VSNRKRIAFIFASNGPANLNPLRYAIEDANRIAESLASSTCGFDVVRPTPGSDPFDLRRQLFTITESCKPEDLIICYFSGHGVLSKGNLFLLWDGTDIDRPISTAIPASDILQALHYCEAKSKLLILDCCHAGAAAEKIGTKNAAGIPVADTNLHADNHLVLMASGRVESARELEELRGSFLTVNLCAALNENLYDADVDQDGRLSVNDLARWLERQANRHNNGFPDQRVPIPYLFGRQKGEFFLTWEETDWRPYEFPCADGTTMVVLPIFQAIYGRADAVLCMGKYSILNKQYRRFIDYAAYSAGGPSEPVGESFSENEWKGPFYPWREQEFNHPDQPVVCVKYNDALGYCSWAARLIGQVADSARSRIPRGAEMMQLVEEEFRRQFYAGQVAVVPVREVRLATASEWDFAAYGTNYPSRHPRSWLSRTLSIHHRANSPARIDTTEARSNAWGLSDMFGNVWEWCLEEDRSVPGIAVFSDIGTPRARRGINLRGGGFLDDLQQVRPEIDSAILRDGIYTSHSDLGFRIAGVVFLEDLPEDTRSRLSAWRGTYVGFPAPARISVISGDIHLP